MSKLSKVYLVARLAVRDLRHRPGQAAMLAIIMVAATAALALGLVLHGTTAHPYQTTRNATSGPDALATGFSSSGPAALRQVAPLTRAHGVTRSSGPFPVAFPVLAFDGHSDAVLAEGRGSAPATVDQPELTEGSWVHAGEVVIERSFADAVGIHAGDRITLNSRPFTVAGVAVTAAFPDNGVGFLEDSPRWPNPGLIWTTTADAESLATAQHPLGYVLNLKLTDSGAAEGFADRFDPGGYTNNTGGLYVIPWQMISRQDGLLVAHEQKILLVGSWLLALLAIASLTVVVGGRMAEQNRRVGLLKAVGATPAFVAGVLLAEYLALAVIAAAAGLLIGRLVAPWLTSPGASLVGTAGVPQLTLPTIGLVLLAALAVAALASYVPALRAARTSTVDALADAARPPRRHPRLTVYSSSIPVPLLLAIRLAVRRPRRVLLGSLSIAVTVSGIVAVLFAHASLVLSQSANPATIANPGLADTGFLSPATQENQVLLIITILLAALATVNVTVITWATVQDSRHTAAITRALGASASQLTVGLSAAQVLPATAGALAGLAGGYGLFTVASQGGSVSQPPAWWLVAAVLGSLIAVAGLTAIPARLSTRLPIARTLQANG
ncbi:MAG TPA: FtsX-like permease family protein, partial [Streptosporangiaceae bacterium]